MIGSTVLRVLAIACVFVFGLAACGGKDDSLSQRTGSAVSGAATDFLSGLGEGVDKKMTVALESDPSLAAKGLVVSLGKDSGMGTNVSAIYVIAEKAFAGKMVAKALDRDGKEIGRSTADVDLAADDARYVNFNFNAEMDSQMVRTYVVSVR